MIFRTVPDIRIVGDIRGMSPEPRAAKMRNHNADDREFSSLLKSIYIYEATITIIFWDDLNFI